MAEGDEHGERDLKMKEERERGGRGEEGKRRRKRERRKDGYTIELQGGSQERGR
jgi:hypothetical protein